MSGEISVRTSITGTVNDQLLKGSVQAILDPDRGGRSACEFSDLPRDFTPAALGTFA